MLGPAIPAGIVMCLEQAELYWAYFNWRDWERPQHGDAAGAGELLRVAPSRRHEVVIEQMFEKTLT